MRFKLCYAACVVTVTARSYAPRPRSSSWLSDVPAGYSVKNDHRAQEIFRFENEHSKHTKTTFLQFDPRKNKESPDKLGQKTSDHLTGATNGSTQTHDAETTGKENTGDNVPNSADVGQPNAPTNKVGKWHKRNQCRKKKQYAAKLDAAKAKLDAAEQDTGNAAFGARPHSSSEISTCASLPPDPEEQFSATASPESPPLINWTNLPLAQPAWHPQELDLRLAASFQAHLHLAGPPPGPSPPRGVPVVYLDRRGIPFMLPRLLVI